MASLHGLCRPSLARRRSDATSRASKHRFDDTASGSSLCSGSVWAWPSTLKPHSATSPVPDLLPRVLEPFTRAPCPARLSPLFLSVPSWPARTHVNSLCLHSTHPFQAVYRSGHPIPLVEAGADPSWLDPSNTPALEIEFFATLMTPKGSSHCL